MALADLGIFIAQRLNVYDPTLDTSSGSPLDTQVVQPILRRLGTDPFSVDFVQFVQDRLAQEFPDLATKDGDALTDLLIKPGVVLFDPIIREIARIQNGLSFKDPTTLTVDEAAALGANLFATINTGDFARGQARIYFAAPQDASVSPANFVSSNTGLHYYPTAVQSITSAEMLYNVEGTLYYFDINLIAEAAGDSYNIGIDQLVSIANITAAVRVTNKQPFRFGTPAETAVEFVGRAEQELSERSLVTQRGIIAQITNAFSEVTQVAPIGFGDPEMQRDIITGGGLGAIQASGFLLYPIPDTLGGLLTRRIQIDSSEPVDFTVLIGPPGPVTNATLTVHGGFAVVPQVRDLQVLAVIDPRTLDVTEQVFSYGISPGQPWVLRLNQLTLSGIPGGILFPNTPNGELTVPPNEIHIGGCADTFIRATDFDTSTLVLSDVVDDSPVLQGTEVTVLDSAGHVQVTDFVLGTNYALNDPTWQAFNNAYIYGWSLTILDGPAAGSYRVLSSVQTSAQSPVLLVDPAPPNPVGTFRWSLSSSIYVDLTDPKETKISGSDLITTQGSNIIETGSGTDFDTYGVGPNDTVRILNGPDAGDYVVSQVLTPLYQRVQLTKSLTSTGADLQYLIFRANAGGPISLPLTRITSINLLDASGQPTGSIVPYANPVDVESNSFANVAHGIKKDLTDGVLGLVSMSLVSGANVSGKTLTIYYGPTQATATSTIVVDFVGTNPLTPAQIVAAINAAAVSRISSVVDTNYVGILPFAAFVYVEPTDTATSLIFGANTIYTTSDIRSPAMDATLGRWASITPAIDVNYDVVQVLDGAQIGYYDDLTVSSDAHQLLSAGTSFLPDVGRHIQVGARSLGTALLYFLDPTSISFDANAVFSTTLSSGTVLRYFTDKTESYQLLPALPSDPYPKDGALTSPNVFTSASGDFYRQGILPGDELYVTYQPITCTATLTDPVPGLVYQTLILSVGGGIDKTIIFVNDSGSVPSTAVTRAGVATQINSIVGTTICSITSANVLEFEADQDIILRATGTANATLGISTSVDTNNTSPIAGNYSITSLTATSFTIAATLSGSPVRQHFYVTRPNLQRIVSTTMSTQVGTAGLYYVEIQLISEGTGDIYNIPASTQMTVTGFTSDGYYLTTKDPNLTFSTVETPILHVSRSILEVGVSDSPLNATQISGQNLQINYELSNLTASVQSFVSSDEERVICESPLARHLIPYFVRFDLTYIGGSAVSVVTSDITDFINNLTPSDYLNVSDLEGILQTDGAVSVQNPIDLVAVIHNFDRSITVERSQDKINTGRLAAFVPDVLNLTRNLS